MIPTNENDEIATRPRLICGLCGGEIGIGWPVVQLAAGDLAHRYRTECDWYRERPEEVYL